MQEASNFWNERMDGIENSFCCQANKSEPNNSQIDPNSIPKKQNEINFTSVKEKRIFGTDLKYREEIRSNNDFTTHDEEIKEIISNSI